MHSKLAQQQFFHVQSYTSIYQQLKKILWNRNQSSLFQSPFKRSDFLKDRNIFILPKIPGKPIFPQKPLPTPQNPSLAFPSPIAYLFFLTRVKIANYARGRVRKSIRQRIQHRLYRGTCTLSPAHAHSIRNLRVFMRALESSRVVSTGSRYGRVVTARTAYFATGGRGSRVPPPRPPPTWSVPAHWTPLSRHSPVSLAPARRASRSRAHVAPLIAPRSFFFLYVAMSSSAVNGPPLNGQNARSGPLPLSPSWFLPHFRGSPDRAIVRAPTRVPRSCIFRDIFHFPRFSVCKL